MRVPILRIPFAASDVNFIQHATGEILASGALTMGKYTKEFEERFARFNGSKYAMAVSNGTSALEVILRALEIEGKSVIVPTNTFLATAFAVMHAGNRVIFADSDPETFAFDPADVERKIAPDTKAIILVHIGGTITPEVETLKALCDRRGLLLIEDCAHAHGSVYRGRKAGTLGIAGAFSFFPTKVFVTGEGGMVTTDDEAVYRTTLKIRNHGKDPALGNKMSVFGNNLRISEIAAAIGVQQMSRADEIVAARQEIASQYDRSLDPTILRPLRLADGVTSTYYKYIAYLPEGVQRDRVKQVMRDRFGVALTGEVYADLCHREPLWQKYNAWGRLRTGRESQDELVSAEAVYPGADHLSGRHVCLPLYPGLTPADVDYVVESVNQAIAEQVASAV